MHDHQYICVLGEVLQKTLRLYIWLYDIKVYLIFLTCSAVGLVSGSFCRQESTKEQNSGENLFFDGDGDGSSRICHKTRYN